MDWNVINSRGFWTTFQNEDNRDYNREIKKMILYANWRVPISSQILTDFQPTPYTHVPLSLVDLGVWDNLARNISFPFEAHLVLMVKLRKLFPKLFLKLTLSLSHFISTPWWVVLKGSASSCFAFNSHASDRNVGEADFVYIQKVISSTRICWTPMQHTSLREL